MTWDKIFERLDVLLEPTVILILAIVGYWQGQRTWKKQKRLEFESNVEFKEKELEFLERQHNEEMNARFKETKYNNCIDAHKAAWALIVYFSEKDNDSNMLLCTRDRENVNYYFRRKLATEFFAALQKTFYTDGYGFFLSRDVKRGLYKIRSLAYFFLQIANEKDEDVILIEDENRLKRLKQIRSSLILNLKAEIDKY